MIREVLAIMKYKGYKIYSKPYELNIVGVRSEQTKANSFDDMLMVFYSDSNRKWHYSQYPATTDPGTYWLEHPMNVDGTSILKEGQYVNAYKIGLHKGQYEALVQAAPVTVIRDYDRSAILDFFNGTQQTGLFGIDIHRGLAVGTTKTVDKWSAGCQVFANANDFKAFIALCEMHRKYNGNLFTYTLIDQRAIARQTRRWITYGVIGGTATLTLAGIVTWTLLKNQH